MFATQKWIGTGMSLKVSTCHQIIQPAMNGKLFVDAQIPPGCSCTTQTSPDWHPSLIGGKQVLTTHTSNGQVREMERVDSKPPIRMINIARCYRRQQDATHTQMFHQFEGLVIDKNITIHTLKGTLEYFANQFLWQRHKKVGLTISFPLHWPSFEVDFSCHICQWHR